MTLSMPLLHRAATKFPAQGGIGPEEERAFGTRENGGNHHSKRLFKSDDPVTIAQFEAKEVIQRPWPGAT